MKGRDLVTDPRSAGDPEPGKEVARPVRIVMWSVYALLLVTVAMPVVVVLSVLGFPVGLALAVVALPIFALLFVVGLPVFMVLIVGAAVLSVIMLLFGLVIDLGAAVLKFAAFVVLPIGLLAWMSRSLYKMARTDRRHLDV